MSANHSSKAALIRSRLKHPVIDADGHWVEFTPVVKEFIRRVGGDKAADGFAAVEGLITRVLSFSDDERRARRAAQQGWWSFPTANTVDRATALFPRLLYERLDELGLDFAVLYPTGALGIAFNPDADTRRATCRAFNTYIAQEFGPLADRMTPAAVIPMDTPDEAIAELEYAVGKLGLKVVVMASLMRRPIEAIARKVPPAARFASWYDPIGLDGQYDYDPVWAKCQELGVAPTFHSGSRGFGLRTSPTNFVYNHIGHFAAAGEAVCKALFIGGVTRALSATEVCIPGRRRRMGVQPVLGSDWPLEEAQPRGAGGGKSSQSQPSAAHRVGRALRRRRDGRISAQVGRRDRGSGADARRSARAAGRFCGVRNPARRGYPRSFRAQLLLRMRGGRPHQCLGVQPQGQSLRGAAQRVVRIGYRPFRRPGYGRGACPRPMNWSKSH